MLLSFRVVNHRSLRDLQHLNLAPVYEADRPEGTSWPAVPVAAIYGANASGKSNVIDALTYLRDMVLSSDRSAEPGMGIARIPFRLDPAVARMPSSFDVDAMVDGTHHTYGFTIDDGGVVEEWLHRYPRKRRQIVFAREGRRYRYGTTAHPDLREAEGITADNALFMSVAARAGKSEMAPFYRWVRAMRLPTRTTPRFAVGLHRRSLAARLAQAAEDKASHEAVLELLRAADLGIEDFGATDVNPDFVVEHEGTRWVVEFKQFGMYSVAAQPFRGDIWFRMRGAQGGSTLALKDQSAGTLLFAERMLDVLDVLASGSVMVVDELESNLHPNLAGQIVRLFQNPAANPHAAQLVFTSHDTSLLGSNAETLKRDQVWFVEKDYTSGATRLFPLTDFKPRDSENTERRYRSGSYNAVPFLDEEAAAGAVARFLKQPAQSATADA